jgi:hypothetical protein
MLEFLIFVLKTFGIIITSVKDEITEQRNTLIEIELFQLFASLCMLFIMSQAFKFIFQYLHK